MQNGYATKKKPLTTREQLALGLACTNDEDKLLVGVLVNTGMKLPEWVRMRAEHLDGRKLRVGKRTLRVSPRTARLIARWFGSADAMPLRERAAEYRLQAIAKRAGIRKKVTPDVLRRTFAQNAIANGVEFTHLRDHLGMTTEQMARLFSLYEE